MYLVRRALAPAVAAAITVGAIIFIGLAAGAQAEETAADIPANSYYKDPLTSAERAGIASEEDVSPNDGTPSVPPSSDDGVIPDAAIDQRSAAADDSQPSSESLENRKSGESEADVVIDDSKKNYKVSAKEIAECEKQWGPATQMTREEWAASCRTTLEYFPEPQ